jgi:hypothetical protein
MERSHLPLLTWFRAITAIWKKPELSIKELQRQMKITYKTAWSINHRIRKPWSYLLIPHDVIDESRTLQGLAAAYTLKSSGLTDKTVAS